MSICVGTTVPACPLVEMGAFIPSATGLSAAPHSGDQEDGVSQLQPDPAPPPCTTQSMWPLTSPSSPSLGLIEDGGVGVWAAAVKKQEAELCR